MTLEEVFATMADLTRRWPVVRGRKTEFFALCIGSNGDGTIEAWFQTKPPRKLTKAEMACFIRAEHEWNAEATFWDLAHLEKLLSGQVEPVWLLKDEDARDVK